MKRSSFFAIRSAGKLLECLRIQKVNAFKHLVQNRSNAEKTAIISAMTEITVDSGTDVSKKKKKKHSAFGLKAWVFYTGCWLNVF